ncbi:hypothetical protein BSK48_02315 [Paenibacillus odorifer]|nr:hypothetical protein BSK48_02315 [Paenibacillus odorifer]
MLNIFISVTLKGMNFIKSLVGIFSRKYTKSIPFLLLFSLFILAFSAVNRIFPIISFLIIMLNALYIVVKIAIFKIKK